MFHKMLMYQGLILKAEAKSFEHMQELWVVKYSGPELCKFVLKSLGSNAITQGICYCSSPPINDMFLQPSSKFGSVSSWQANSISLPTMQIPSTTVLGMAVPCALHFVLGCNNPRVILNLDNSDSFRTFIIHLDFCLA